MKRLWFWYSDRIAHMTTGERAILIADLVILLSLWAIFWLVLNIIEKVIAHHHV